MQTPGLFPRPFILCLLMASYPPPSWKPEDARSTDRERLPTGAFAFVVLALIALVVAPNLLMRRISASMEEISTMLLPTNDALSDLAFAMEERVTAARTRFVTNDPRYEERLAAAKRDEAETLRKLVELAPRFGESNARRFEVLQMHVARRDSLEAAIVDDPNQIEAYREALPAFDAIHDEMVRELNGFRHELMREVDDRVRTEAYWASRQRIISLLIGVVALIAALLVGWSALHQRDLRRKIQAALEDANRQRFIAERREQELVRAAEARARLLRGVTHDVKNPLGAAKGYAELLELGIKAPLAPGQAPLVKGVTRSIDAALAILADLLDLARADSGGLAVKRVEVRVGTLMYEAVEGHRPSAEAAGHQIEVDAPLEDLRIYTDPARVGQVLANLLSNAIKYTPPPGRIVVRCETRDGVDTLEGRPCTTIQVCDTGPGIPPDQREAIFDEFTRLDDNSPQKGHGLGLAIARRVARLLGGDLSVEDAPEGGANFVLWLPERREESQKASPAA